MTVPLNQFLSYVPQRNYNLKPNRGHMNNLSKNLFSAVITIQLLFVGSLFFNTAEAASRCSLRTLVEESARVESNGFQVSRLEGIDKIKLKAGTIRKLKEVFDKNDWELNATKITEVIEGAAKLIKGKSRAASIARSNKMAEVGREILKTVHADLNEAQTKMVTYMIAESVLRLETMKITEFKAGEDLPVFKKKSTLHIDKIHDLVESYVDGTAGYRDLPQDGGFLSWVEIRGLYANNSWAIGLRNHDMYHLHYAYGHPYYLAINMHTSRSINDRRYAMASTLWEAVDTFRTGYESSIARYFNNKNMTAEEAMLFLGSATEKELDQVDAETGGYTQLNSLNQLSYAGGWRPVKTKFGRNMTSYNEATFLKEIAAFINTSIEKLKDSSNKKYANYHRNGPGVAAERDDSDIPGY